MTVKYLFFTDKGGQLARKLAANLGGSAERCGEGGVSLAAWTAQNFAAGHALVYVGAVGIAVRAIAPHCRSKASDPAVVAVDECARFAVPLLSGHLGGANDLARRIANVCGAVPVITTATDANGVFAVDEWAKRQNCAVIEPERIKRVSGALLAGKTVHCASDWPVAGELPAGVELLAGGSACADFAVSIFDDGAPCLHLAPRAAVLGVGCKKGISVQQLEEAFAAFVKENALFVPAICGAASIDLKKEEAGLLAFCQSHGWPLQFFSAQQLRQAQGSFTPSAFVQSVTGVDNVCERAAALAAGGPLSIPKRAGGGVTFALACRPVALTWRWQA